MFRELKDRCPDPLSHGPRSPSNVSVPLKPWVLLDVKKSVLCLEFEERKPYFRDRGFPTTGLSRRTEGDDTGCLRLSLTRVPVVEVTGSSPKKHLSLLLRKQTRTRVSPGPRLRVLYQILEPLPSHTSRLLFPRKSYRRTNFRGGKNRSAVTVTGLSRPGPQRRSGPTDGGATLNSKDLPRANNTWRPEVGDKSQTPSLPHAIG